MKDFKARMFDAEGEEIAKRIRCKNDDPGAESFVKYLVEICGAFGRATIWMFLLSK